MYFYNTLNFILNNMQLDKLLPLLLRQNMKHYQLLQGLESLGLDTQLHHLDLQEIIAQLMGIPEGKASNRWSDVYMQFLDMATQVAITPRGENLQELAEQGCSVLMAMLEEV